MHAVAQGLEEQGFGPQLLAAVFRFEGGKHPVYWIYGYKRGAFWPFVPTGEGQERKVRAERESGDGAGHLPLVRRLRRPGLTEPRRLPGTKAANCGFYITLTSSRATNDLDMTSS